MLKQIFCEKFTDKTVCFQPGLNAIVGDDVASNSIGKSTMLMIIDYIFGGSDYITKNHDVIEQLGHHEFKFIFEFQITQFYFMRSTNSYKYISVCDDKFEIKETINLDEFTSWLQEKYNCELEELSFRNIVGRYFRIYGKENLNERKPIQYVDKETPDASIIALLKLFNKYSTLKQYEIHIKTLQEEKVTLLNAAKNGLISYINTKTLFGKNEKNIVELTNQLESLKKDILTASTNLEALVSKEILELRKNKSELLTHKNTLTSRLARTQSNIKKNNPNIKTELDQLIYYFPNFDVRQVEKVDNFHIIIAQNLIAELRVAEKELKLQISYTDEKIEVIEAEINSKLKIEDAPNFAIDKIIELVAERKQLSDENGYYRKRKGLEESIASSKIDLNTLKICVLDEICSIINIKMHEINKVIYPDGRRSPTLNIHGTKYTFDTYGDTGTGTAFANLITFDLALLELTCVPAITHDLPLLKNIENEALENIIEIYSKSIKQIFIAIDKLNSYNKKISKIIEENKVLGLSKEKLLFTKNWKKS